jgi:pimeloyl-ACP methyl ester carboxylesterase
MIKKIFVLFFLAAASSAKAQNSFVGIWEGKMNVGVELRMIFHFSQDAAKNFIATMDCPGQGIKDVKASTLQLTGDSVYLEISQFQVKYWGKLTSDSLISGTFQQGMSLPLNFKKIKIVTEITRPQTPVAPFPYAAEELVYYDADKSITYGATITIPTGKGPFPAVLLLTGSGQQNRDEEILGHKPFAVIADHLTRNGFIVLRVDDRGMGKTTGDVLSATTRDFANDAIVGINYLKGRKEVNKSKIGLIGHSEGAMIAQIIAAERADIDFVVMLAGPGEQTLKVMNDQNEAVLTKMGLPKDHIASYLDLYNQILTTILSSDGRTAVNNVKAVVDKWIGNTPVNIVLATTGIRDESTRNNFVNQFVGQLSSPWIKYFLSYDPAEKIKNIAASVLAVNGSQDIQVVPGANLKAIEAALNGGKSKFFEVKELKGLNHLFQECHTCTTNEYDQLDQTISPVLLETITTWMKKAIR